MSCLAKSLKNICRTLLPYKIYLRIEYFAYFKKILHIKNPRKFSEKQFCMKFLCEYKQGLYRKCYDKYNVRSYIKEKLPTTVSDAILNKLYGVYQNAEDIPFDKLPSKFVLKITQSSGFNIICTNKGDLNIENVIKKLNSWLLYVNNNSNKYDESYLFDGKAQILCEKFLENQNGEIPDDIRIYCFNGEAKLFIYDIGTTNYDGSHGEHIIRNVYDREWNLVDVDLGRKHDETVIVEKPGNLDDLIKVAELLAQDFPFVRVDLYNVNEKIYFGELTWIPMGGICLIKPEKYDYILGDWLELSDYN